MNLSICQKSFREFNGTFLILDNIKQKRYWQCVKTSLLELNLFYMIYFDISIFLFYSKTKQVTSRKHCKWFWKCSILPVGGATLRRGNFWEPSFKSCPFSMFKAFCSSSLKTCCHTLVWLWQTHYSVSLCFALKQRRLAGHYLRKHEWKKRLVAHGALYEAPRHPRLWGEPRAFRNKSISDENPLSRWIIRLTAKCHVSNASVWNSNVN